MICPKCNTGSIQVVDSRHRGGTVYRTRACENCGERWRTAERIFTPAETDLATLYPDGTKNLIKLVEECGEVVRISSKCILWGLDDYHPKNGAVNRTALAEECGHVQAMVRVLVATGAVDDRVVARAEENKLVDMKNWY